MHPVNWVVVLGYLAFVVVDGVRRSKNTRDLDGYLLANRALPWWAVGLSVMATQLSAVTLIGTTGQGATDGLRFVQFYFGLPLAMVILGVTLVPLLRGAGVYTAYEYLERRFGAPVRTLAACLFLVGRGMSCGVIVAAPAVVFAAVFGWPLAWCVALIGLPAVLYAMLGGVQAVTWADVKQMVLIVLAVSAVVVVLLVQMPVSPGEALRIAGATGRLQVFDFSLTATETYTFWSGLIGGAFLMLSYFGTDQSQVQRYLAADSVNAARQSLLVSAYWKIPLQALVLLIGVLVFVYYQFQAPPLLFNPAHEAAVQVERGDDYDALRQRFGDALVLREDAARRTADAPDPAQARAAMEDFLAREASVQDVREEALALAEEVTGQPSNDVNYIVPRFVLGELPVGLSGLFVAAVIAAAMSSISSELNSLSTASVVDVYRRWVHPQWIGAVRLVHWRRPVDVYRRWERLRAADAHYLAVSKAATLFWGLFACVVALYAVSLGSLIEVVNRYGSYFYGPILGVFLLALIPRARGRGALLGMLFAAAVVWTTAWLAPQVSFLWYNVIGSGTVVLVGLLPGLAGGRQGRRDPGRTDRTG